MQLILLVLIAFVIGYLLAGSKFRKPIDEASEKVSTTSKDLAGKVENWWSKLFNKSQPPEKQVIDVPVSANTEEEKQVAEKRPSRRKAEEDVSE
jgi:hypothetical protein